MTDHLEPDLDALIPPGEQIDMEIRAEALEDIRIHAACGCPWSMRLMDAAIATAKLYGAPLADIRQAYNDGATERR